MNAKVFPLKRRSIEDLFFSGEECVYEIPVYQRNYAWEKDEISALVQDIYDAYSNPENADGKRPYYIGTLVTYRRGEGIYEIIDGQQRLTTLWLLLKVFDESNTNPPRNQLTYRARRKSDETLKNITKSKEGEKDTGIKNGYDCAKEAVKGLTLGEKREDFIKYFMNQVFIIHYKVPRDINLNHYFEVMNSRGEQLEKHEIVKAMLMQELDDAEAGVFSSIWESCSEMGTYVQQNLAGISREKVFGETLNTFLPGSFDDIMTAKKAEGGRPEKKTLESIILSDEKEEWNSSKNESQRKDLFLPVIDFPNFLLIVLKIMEMDESDPRQNAFILDDKELIKAFENSQMDAGKVRKFALNLLKARFLLDNYVVHHSKEEDTADSNPWELEVWQKQENNRKEEYSRNLADNKDLQKRLVHLLSMFEVSFAARQRKNYLLYCLLYLMRNRERKPEDYAEFVENLADRYFNEVYLDKAKLNTNNNPRPGSFDEAVLDGKELRWGKAAIRDRSVFGQIYGEGTAVSKGVPLFVFNYLDYRLWKFYSTELRRKGFEKGSRERNEFFDRLGCGDFGQEVFDQFYFSRTRRSLEHYYARANATGKDGALDENQINCFGNYAMIGSEANSAGSNWSPEAKVTNYLDSSKKINPVSVSSLKFRIMMQMCRDNQENGNGTGYWTFDDIKKHQEIMISFMLNKEYPSDNDGDGLDCTGELADQQQKQGFHCIGEDSGESAGGILKDNSVQ